MTEAPVWGIVFAVFLVVGSLTFTGLLETWNQQTHWTQEASQRRQDQLETAIAIQSAGATSLACPGFAGPFKARAVNSGVRLVTDLSHMDVLVDYPSATGARVANRLSYGAGWTLAGLSPDRRDPGLWSPDETATIQFSLGQALQTGSKGMLVLVTPQGVPDSSYFSCEPPLATGFRSPTAQAADTGGSGNGFEVSPANAFADDLLYATNVNGNGDRHRFYNYGIAIPSDRAIFGIEVRLDWWLLNVLGDNSLGVELSWDGGASWTTAKTDSAESISEHTTVLGSSGDTWGRTWSASEFTDANFRVRVTSSSTLAQTVFLDWAPVNVHYEAQ